MKKQIENLIEIAKQYHKIGMALNLPMTHNHIRTKTGNFQSLKCYKDGRKITIYLADKGKTWQAEFDKVTIVGYSERVQLPFDVTAKYLNELYEDAKDHLENHLKPHLEEFKVDLSSKKLEEIKRLEEQIEALKSEL